MKIGYACINLSVEPTFRTCRVATAEKEGMDKIKELTLQNLELTKEIIKWNIEHHMLFYRLSSGVVVLATHPVNTWNWKQDPDVQTVCADIKALKEAHGVRLSLHPGQYSVLNSPKNDVVERTIADLTYHTDLLDLVGGSDMILHLGGKYGDRQSALERLVCNTHNLPVRVKEKLRFENDDKVFNLEDALYVAQQTDVPVCFDIHHHFCNPADEALEVLLEEVWETWRGTGRPKVHISSGRSYQTDRSHHNYIMPEDFNRLMDYVGKAEVDVMVEAKKKNLAALELLQTFNMSLD